MTPTPPTTQSQGDHAAQQVDRLLGDAASLLKHADQAQLVVDQPGAVRRV